MSLQLESFQYILDKNRSKIYDLPEKDRIYIFNKFEELINQINPQNFETENQKYRMPLKRKIQLKLISMINQL